MIDVGIASLLTAGAVAAVGYELFITSPLRKRVKRADAEVVEYLKSIEAHRKQTCDERNLRIAAEADRDFMKMQAKARKELLSAAGRAGAIAVNAKRAAARKDSAAKTIADLGKTAMRPREDVVKGVPAARKRKQAAKQSGAEVAA